MALARALLFLSVATQACAGARAEPATVIAPAPPCAPQEVAATEGAPRVFPTSEPEPKVFATPEAAIEHYVRSIVANDFESAMQALVFKRLASNVDFVAFSKYTGIINVSSGYAPSNYPLYARLNEIKALAGFAQSTKIFVYGLLTDTGADGSTVKAGSDADIEAFVKEVDPQRLRALAIVRVDLPKKSMNTSAKFLALAKENAARYGARDYVERIALYRLGDQHFFSGFHLLAYENSWFILDFLSYSVGPISAGMVQKTTPAEYEALLD